MADGLQFLPSNVQSLLNYAQQNSNVVRPAQAMGANNSGSTYGFAPMQQSPQSNVGMPQLPQAPAFNPNQQKPQSTPANSSQSASPLTGMGDTTSLVVPNSIGAGGVTGGLGTNTGFGDLGIGTGSGALGLGNGQTLSDLGSAIGNGTGTVGQGLGALFSLIGL
jgi:hypothetical protein